MLQPHSSRLPPLDLSKDYQSRTKSPEPGQVSLFARQPPSCSAQSAPVLAAAAATWASSSPIVRLRRRSRMPQTHQKSALILKARCLPNATMMALTSGGPSPLPMSSVSVCSANALVHGCRREAVEPDSGCMRACTRARTCTMCAQSHTCRVWRACCS